MGKSKSKNAWLTHQCCALDDNGRRCTRRTTQKRDIHRTSDHLGWSWCRVFLCIKHGGDARNETELKQC